MQEKSASQQIDDIITSYGGWKGEILSQVRTVINHADPDVVEEIKWKMPSLPEGRPVWSHDGIVCIAEVFKNDIKIVFFKGAMLSDPHGLFNARLKSKTDRAIEFHEGDTVNQPGLAGLVSEAALLNQQKAAKR